MCVCVWSVSCILFSQSFLVSPWADGLVSLIVIRWLLGVYLSGPSKIKSYGPSDFYDNSDKDSDGESAKYPEHKSKIRVIKAAMGMKKVNQEESKQIMLMSQKDIDRLARLEQLEAEIQKEVRDKDHTLRKIVEEDEKQASSNSSQNM